MSININHTEGSIRVTQESLILSANGYFVLPKGTTAQRPSGIAGAIRYNTTNNIFEGYSSGDWKKVLLSGEPGIVNISNAGGTSFIKNNDGQKIEFYGLFGGGDIDINIGASAITISADTGIVNATSVGDGISIIDNVANKTLTLRKIKGSNVQVRLSGNNIVISANSQVQYLSSSPSFRFASVTSAFASFFQTGHFTIHPDNEYEAIYWFHKHGSGGYLDERGNYLYLPYKDTWHEIDRTTGFKVAKVKNHSRNAFLITQNGTLYGAGYNSVGELGIGNTTEQREFIALLSSQAVSGQVIDVQHTSWITNNNCSTFVLFQENDGTRKILAAGANLGGQLGNGTTTNSNVWVEVITSAGTPLTNVKSMSMSHGDYASCLAVVSAVSGYQIYAWGGNDTGILGLGDTVNRKYATLVTSIPTSALVTEPKVRAFSWGTIHNFAFIIAGHRLYFSGKNIGQAGNGTTTNYNSFVDVTPANFIPLEVEGVGHNNGQVSYLYGQDTITGNYKILSAGYNGNGALGVGDTVNKTTWTETSGLPVFTSAGAVKYLHAVGSHTLAKCIVITADNEVYVTGDYMDNFTKEKTNTHARYFKKVHMHITGNIIEATPLYMAEYSHLFVYVIITDKNEFVWFRYYYDAGNNTTYIDNPRLEVIK